ncbi:MAG TPA: hypothetical protein VNA89_01325 [Gemmatimonadaceae bacterium]|nr:hypothetical protein [Gemmatimonadaceae bacterium]
MKVYVSPDGTRWGVAVRSPGSSNAMVVFYHPNGQTARLDRYNWYITHGPEARSVTARLSPAKVLDQLDDRQLARLFRRSMPIHTERKAPVNLPVMPL